MPLRLGERLQPLAGEAVREHRHEHLDASRRRAGRATRRCSGRSSPGRRSPRTRPRAASAACPRGCCVTGSSACAMRASSVSTAIDAWCRHDDKVIDLCQYPCVKTIATIAASCPPLLQAAARGGRGRAARRSALKAIADPARLRLLSLIQAQPDHEACVCHLTEPLGAEPTDRQPSPQGALAGWPGRARAARQLGLLPRARGAARGAARAARLGRAQQQPALAAGWIRAVPSPRDRRLDGLDDRAVHPVGHLMGELDLICSKPAASSPASYSLFESAPAMQPT